MTAIVTSLIGAVVQEAGDRFRISKTKIAANIGGVNGFFVLLPGVMAKDPTAIGQMVLLILAWLGTLWGRGNKG